MVELEIRGQPTQTGTRARQAGWLSTLDERVMLASACIGSVAFFIGQAYGILLYMGLFLWFCIRRKQSLLLVLNLAVIAPVTLYAASQFDETVLWELLLVGVVPVAGLYLMRYVDNTKLLFYAGAVVARVALPERLRRVRGLWALIGAAAGYAAVQVFYESLTTVWGALALIATSMLLPQRSVAKTTFIWVGVAVYALLTTLVLWKGAQLLVSEPLLVVRSYVPDMLIPLALTGIFAAIGGDSKRASVSETPVLQESLEMQEQVREQDERSLKTIFCTSCGSPMKDESRFCSSCGAQAMP